MVTRVDRNRLRRFSVKICLSALGCSCEMISLFSGVIRAEYNQQMEESPDLPFIHFPPNLSVMFVIRLNNRNGFL